MAVGEMIHGADFSLSEAMSALELMDPKMDDGMHDVSPGPKGAAGPHGTYPPPSSSGFSTPLRRCYV